MGFMTFHVVCSIEYEDKLYEVDKLVQLSSWIKLDWSEFW